MTESVSDAMTAVQNWYAAGAPLVAAAANAPALPVSPSGASINSVGAYLVDADGTWTLVAGSRPGVQENPPQQISLNGTVDPVSGSVIELVLWNGVMYQQAAAGWWKGKPGAWTSAPSDPRTPVTPQPTGVPGNWELIINDSFGSAKTPPANYTSAEQFFTATQPDSSYGPTAQGWDLWQASWGNQPPGAQANVSMATDHLALAPNPNADNGGPAMMVSHNEQDLTNATALELFHEYRVMTGRGQLANTWPALWLSEGNESTRREDGSEIDHMETWTDQQWNSPQTLNGFTNYFQTSINPTQSEKEGVTSQTSPIDVTVTWNVLGFHRYFVNGVPQLDIYFNGKKTGNTVKGIPWTASPAAIIMGWNPGQTPVTPAVLAVDYVRLWKMQT
jgi:hypothetical protein